VITKLFTESSSRQAIQKKALLETVRFSPVYCFTCLEGRRLYPHHLRWCYLIKLRHSSGADVILVEAVEVVFFGVAGKSV